MRTQLLLMDYAIHECSFTQVVSEQNVILLIREILHFISGANISGSLYKETTYPIPESIDRLSSSWLLDPDPRLPVESWSSVSSDIALSSS